MKLWVSLKNESAEKAIQFYVHELGMFTHDGNVWKSACSLRPIGNDGFKLMMASWHADPTDIPSFSLVVPDCYREFARLRKVHFASGGGSSRIRTGYWKYLNIQAAPTS